jgi:hypothetical protein
MNAQVEELKVILKEGLVKVVDKVAVPALEEAAKKTETPIDDVVLAALKEPLKQVLKEYIEKI